MFTLISITFIVLFILLITILLYWKYDVIKTKINDYLLEIEKKRLNNKKSKK